MSASVLYDEPGPRARRWIRLCSAVGIAGAAALVTVAVIRLADHNQLDARRWEFVTDPSILRFLALGLLNTLKVAAVAGVLSLVIGALLAIGRLAPARAVRAVATTYVHFWRAIPLLLLIYFIGLGFPTLGLDFPAFWFLVIGLTLYNSAVFAEIFRSGITSLHRGQREAALALGLTFWQTMRMVLLPQAIRRMVPSLVSQYVVLLKDSSLGFVLPYPELLRRGQITGQFSQSVLQAYVVVAVIFIVVNTSLSYLARWLERRQGQRSAAIRARATRRQSSASSHVSVGVGVDAGAGAAPASPAMPVQVALATVTGSAAAAGATAVVTTGAEASSAASAAPPA